MDLSASLSDETTPLLGGKTLADTPVYPLIHTIRVDILAHIDAPLTYEQLLAPDSTYTIVRPLTEKYLQLRNHSAVFCLLLNKVQFVRDSQQLSISTISLARATLCEILAIRVLREWSERSLPLATVLLTPWAMFQGASDDVVEHAKEDGDGDILMQSGTALEMAIISSSKRFIRSPSCQKVIEGIWSGRIIYTASNAHAFIVDNYKKRPIQMYNPHKAPVLDHYRLKVPRVRSFIEYGNFVILFMLYVIAIEGLETDVINWREICFIIYALAFSLDKLAAVREHGLKVFSSSLVNGFDLVFMLIYGVYLSARMYGAHYGDAAAMETGADWLAMGAVMIFPRLAFVTLANNLMILSIRSMLVEFFFLMAVGSFCFVGFVYALYTLGQGRFELSQIGWWLLEVYFGLDASGFEAAHDFHRFLGPALMITYALLSNTLLLTVLVAILGNTFATINADAAAESMFRKAVATIEGVKADSVFSYQLPFNIIAVIGLYPMSFILTPRWFHKVNVFMIRATNLPMLLLISFYERQMYQQLSVWEQVGDLTERYIGSLPRRIKAAAGFEGIVGARKDIGFVFEIEREAGSFYRGWDDDAFEGDEPLPPPFDDGDSGTSTPANEPAIGTSGGSQPYSASPAQASFAESAASEPRVRRESLPSSASSPNVNVPVFARPRRNSSIHATPLGPSPLAHLYVRSPDDPGPFVRRRMTMSASHGALMAGGPGANPTSTSQPALPASPRQVRFADVAKGRLGAPVFDAIAEDGTIRGRRCASDGVGQSTGKPAAPTVQGADDEPQSPRSQTHMRPPSARQGEDASDRTASRGARAETDAGNVPLPQMTPFPSAPPSPGLTVPSPRAPSRGLSPPAVPAQPGLAVPPSPGLVPPSPFAPPSPGASAPPSAYGSPRAAAPGLPFPKRAPTPIGRASRLETEKVDEEGVKERLAELERGQRRVLDLLERLVDRPH
ncbi:hypothetical protein Q5752_003980 [Cryptotrichosporon argae]